MSTSRHRRCRLLGHFSIGYMGIGYDHLDLDGVANPDNAPRYVPLTLRSKRYQTRLVEAPEAWYGRSEVASPLKI